jgi:hypothetical protein
MKRRHMGIKPHKNIYKSRGSNSRRTASVSKTRLIRRTVAAGSRSIVMFIDLCLCFGLCLSLERQKWQLRR